MNKKKIGLSLLIVFILYYSIDSMSHGGIISVVDDIFFYEYEYMDDLGILHQVKTINWDLVKIVTLIVILITVFIVMIILERNKLQARNHTILEVEKTLQYVRRNNAIPHQKKELAEIENICMQLKEEQENQLHLIELQTRQKNDLISYLAHDMKTPLASVIGYLSLLHDVVDVPEKQRQHYIDITLDKANRLESLIDEFFDITRFNLHDIVLTKGKIELYFMFQQLCEQFYPILMQQQKEIKLEMEDDLFFYADADKLARAFNNILKNAISYSYEHTSITIKAHKEGQQLIILFYNHGDEIPQQKLNTIFEKFYRLDKARSTNAGGAGLGLAIAKEIIEAHQGTIQAYSSKQETVFDIRLPLDL